MMIKSLIFIFIIFSNTFEIESKRYKRDSNVTNIYDVIVIGGGVSGLSTCAQLIQNGVKNILLIEASNRLGGRVNTISYDNGLLELGAQWIHGNKNNPVYNLMSSLNEVNTQIQFYTDETIYSSTQDGVSQSETKVDYIDDQIQNIFDKYDENGLPSGTSSSESFGNLLDKDWKNLLKTKLSTYDPKLTGSVYKAKLDDMRSDYACDNFYELSAKGYVNYDEFGGEEFNNLKNGYIKLIQYLSSKLPSNAIKMNEKVANIDWSLAQTNTNGLVKIKTSSSNGALTNYQAKRVVTTVSLGVLKSNHKTMFTPSLPSDKVNVINNLGFGTVNKIFYIFDNQVFSDGQAGLQFLWTNESFTLNAEQKCNLNGNKFYKSFNSLIVPPKKKNVLFGFFVGKDSIFSESLSDECMIDIISEMFTRFFPKLKIPRPRAIVRSKWATNPLIQGSYSFPKVGSSMSDTKILAKPVKNKLFFAGEATTSYIGTVHGAYMTGLSTANAIKALIK